MIEIVCYMGGTCGDLITALLDRRDCSFNISYRTVTHAADRCKLKKPHLFANDVEKDQYCVDIEKYYNSIPSHDIDYHINRGHNFVGIAVSDWAVAFWAAQRFKNVHKPNVWKEMQAACGADSVEDYAQMMIDYSNLVRAHTDRIITLESIRNGLAADEIKKNLGIDLDSDSENLYNNWICLQDRIFLV
jgi:hypothetical protein